MTGGDLPATVLVGAVVAAADTGVWLLAVAVVSTLLVGLLVCWPWPWLADNGDDGGCPCLACTALNDGDDLMDLADTVFDPDARPVNEPRPDRWGRLDGRNRGAWLDHVSRVSSTQNGRWITGRQQEQAGQSLADQVAEFLEAEAEARRPGETTGEIRRGDPGE